MCNSKKSKTQAHCEENLLKQKTDEKDFDGN